MKNLKTFKGKIVCPHCDGNGLIYKTKIEELKSTIFVCDECVATWEDNEEIGVGPRIDLLSFLESSGLKNNKVNLSNEDYNWINDPDLHVTENYYECPLLSIMIWMGDCYDINAVRHVMVKKSILNGLESELSTSISIDKADEICKQCKYSF